MKQHRPAKGAWAALLALGLGCGDSPTEPTSLDVRVDYVSTIVGCPDQADLCYPGCIHHNTPAGARIVPTWGASHLRLATSQTAGRYEGTLPAVPTNTVLRLYATDPGACCLDACSPPSVTSDILLNGTKLTKVVVDGLPAGATAALEFTLSSDGTIRN
jgi:hypothetical protein